MNTSYLPALDIADVHLPAHREFWAHCQKMELRFQRCCACDTWRHPPSPVCASCHSDLYRWEVAPDTAELFSYTVVHHAASAAFRQHVPYNIAIVSFIGLQDIRIVSNVVDAAPEELVIGTPLRLVWQQDGAGRTLPRFERRNAGEMAS